MSKNKSCWQQIDTKLIHATKKISHVGKITLQIKISGTTRKMANFNANHAFYVVENLAHDVFIGQDFLEMYKVIIDIERKKLTIEDNFGSITIHKILMHRIKMCIVIM